MSVALLLAATSPAPAEPVVIDLLVRQPCDRTDEAVMAEEIVVCGERERQAHYRAAPSQERTATPLHKAEVQVADGAALAVETESQDLGAARAQRAMVRLKIKF